MITSADYACVMQASSVQSSHVTKTVSLYNSRSATAGDGGLSVDAKAALSVIGGIAALLSIIHLIGVFISVI